MRGKYANANEQLVIQMKGDCSDLWDFFLPVILMFQEQAS